MTYDFNALLGRLASKKFAQLWPAQQDVLGKYAGSYWNMKDLAVELPTGAGKTLIALLLAEARRAEEKKMAILSANKTLARQMLREAKALGVPVVLMEGKKADISPASKRAFQRATHVAIMNYWVYFNQSPVIDGADILIMDDAHLAEHCLHSLFSVEISRISHRSLFDSLVAELASKCPDYAVLADAGTDLSTAPAPTELLSFIDQQGTSERLREIVDASPLLRTDLDLRFRWQRLRNSLNETNVYISANAIWIRPYVYPLRTNDHYSSATQTVYLSATVGEGGDLVRRLGTRSITHLKVDPAYASTTSGRRFIVMNRMEEGDLPNRVQQVLLAVLKHSPKSLWLCSSETEAQRYRKAVSEWLNQNELVNHPTWLLTPLGDEMDQFKAAPVGHLFVAGRFDGMDFKGNECRVVVITTIPRAINLQEEFLTSYLRDSGFMRRRLNQRIVQALGRCNRAPDDYAVYVLADERFAVHFGRETNREGISPNMIAEIDFAQDIAEEDEDTLAARLDAFLNGDFEEFDNRIAQYLELVPKPKSSGVPPPDTAEDETAGWTALFPSQNYALASDHFEECWDKWRAFSESEIGALHGYHWAKALALAGAQGDKGAQAKFIGVLNEAIGKGGKSSWFNRLRASQARYLNQEELRTAIGESEYADALMRVFDDHIERLGPKGVKFEKWCNDLTAQLASTEHHQFQDGLVQLGKLLAYDASRPKHAAATDCRWRGVWANTREVATFEAKIEHAANQSISASDVGQAHNQLARAEAEFKGLGFTVRGTLITHMTRFHEGAQGSLGPIRVLTKDSVEKLWKRVRDVLTSYRTGWSLDDIPARRQAAAKIRHCLPKPGWLGRAIDSGPLLVEAQQLLAEWK